MKMLLASALLAASIVSAHASSAVSTDNASSVKPFMQTTIIDGETHTYNLALPRDQRRFNFKLTRKDGESETLMASANLTTLVATKRFNDHPKLFGTPVETTQTSKYLIDVRDDNGKPMPVTPITEGVSAVFYFSDNAPTVGTASVHLKFAGTDTQSAFDQTIAVNLNEGETVKTIGAYTLTVTVDAVKTTSTASL